jgi:hypothetical protein
MKIPVRRTFCCIQHCHWDGPVSTMVVPAWSSARMASRGSSRLDRYLQCSRHQQTLPRSTPTHANRRSRCWHRRPHVDRTIWRMAARLARQRRRRRHDAPSDLHAYRHSRYASSSGLHSQKRIYDGWGGWVVQCRRHGWCACQYFWLRVPRRVGADGYTPSDYDLRRRRWSSSSCAVTYSNSTGVVRAASWLFLVYDSSPTIVSTAIIHSNMDDPARYPLHTQYQQDILFSIRASSGPFSSLP